MDLKGKIYVYVCYLMYILFYGYFVICLQKFIVIFSFSCFYVIKILILLKFNGIKVYFDYYYKGQY